MTTWAFDIECADWDVFILGAAVSDDGAVRTFDTPEQVAEWYTSTEKSDIVLSHNGGKYDFLFLLDACRSIRQWKASLAGSAIVSLQARGHADCRDTYRLFPMSLAKWTGTKGEWNHDDTRAGMSSRMRSRLRDYCVQDCRSLLEAWHRDIARAEALGIQIRNSRGDVRRTIGNVAWHTALSLCPLAESRTLEWPEYSSGRDGYYGGRCEVLRTHAPEGHRYDINSAYPWALTREVPTGVPRSVWGPDATRALAAQRPGIYHARVLVPDTLFPHLPHRAPTSGALLWSTGRIEGHWTHVELEAAERHGARIEALRGAVLYPHEQAVYRPFMTEYFRHRQRAKDAGDDAWAGYLKLLLNSLTGKLAQQPEMGTLFVRAEDLPACRCKRSCTCTRWIGGDAFVRLARRVPGNARPHQAAVLTARARALLLDRLHRMDLAAVYCDTDSVYSEVADSDSVGDALGQWKDEGPMRDWRAVAPKLYRYRTDDGDHAKAKGIPRVTFEDVDALRGGAVVSKRVGVEGIRTALARAERFDGRAFVAKEVARGLRQDPRVAGTRFIGKSGVTYPLHRREDGGYEWTGTRLDPRTVLSRLRNAS